MEATEEAAGQGGENEMLAQEDRQVQRQGVLEQEDIQSPVLPVPGRR
jgi:hypothetical protein